VVVVVSFGRRRRRRDEGIREGEQVVVEGRRGGFATTTVYDRITAIVLGNHSTS